MNLQIAVNIAVGVMMPLFIWGLGYISGLSKDLASFKLYVSENYLSKTDGAKSEEALADIRKRVDEILKIVYEMKGRGEAAR